MQRINIIICFVLFCVCFANAKWIDPSAQNCIKNGGKNPYGICEANWNNAKKICESMKARLPLIDELEEVVTSCGGVIDDKQNKNNSAYEDCYNSLGFDSSFYYWSSSKLDKELVWFINFNSGILNNSTEISREYYVRCIK